MLYKCNTLLYNYRWIFSKIFRKATANVKISEEAAYRCFPKSNKSKKITRSERDQEVQIP